MSWPAVRGEVDIPDFVAIETMRLFEPSLYAFIRSHPEDLTGAEPQHGRREDRSAFGERLLATVPEGRRARAQRALPYIFPRLDAIFANMWHSHDWREAERAKRVSSKRRFPIYFNLGLGDGVISADEMEAFRESYVDPLKTRDLVQGYADTVRRTGGTRASVLLNTLMAAADDVSPDDAEKAGRALLAAADLFFNPVDGDRTPEDLPTRWAVSFAIGPILEKATAEVRAKLLAEAIDGPSPIFSTYMVTRMSVEHGRAGEKEAKPEAERSLPLCAVIQLEQSLAARIARDAASGALLGYDDAAGMVWTWANLTNDATVGAWITEEFDKPGFAAWLMRTFTGEGTSHAFGDLVSQRIYTVNRDSLSKLLDVDKLKRVAERMVADCNDPDSAAEHFLQGLQDPF